MEFNVEGEAIPRDALSCANKAYREFVEQDYWAQRNCYMTITDPKQDHNIRVYSVPRIEAGSLHWLLEKFQTTIDSGGQRDASVTWFRPGQHFTEAMNEAIEDFVKTTNKFGFCSLIVEGQARSRPNGDPVCCVTICDAEGRCLIFFDDADLPSRIVRIIEDYSIVKLAQGCITELRELQRVKIHMIGWANSSTIYKCLVEDSSTTGIKAQNGYLVRKTGGKWSPHQKWVFPFKSALERGATGSKLPSAYRQHMIQNLRVPLAILTASVMELARSREFDNTKNVFPYFTEALDLVRSKVTEDLTHFSPDPLQNWVAISPPAMYSRHSCLNDALELTYIRQACANRREPMSQDWLDDATKRAIDRFRLLRTPKNEGKFITINTYFCPSKFLPKSNGNLMVGNVQCGDKIKFYCNGGKFRYVGPWTYHNFSLDCAPIVAQGATKLIGAKKEGIRVHANIHMAE